MNKASNDPKMNLKKIDPNAKRKRIVKDCDKIASKLCLERDGYKCRYCGKPGNQPHHIFSRKFAATRWDLDNLLTLCAGCHRFNFHGAGLHEAISWLQKNVRYEMLKLKKQGYCSTCISNLELIKMKLERLTNEKNIKNHNSLF